MIKNLTLSGLIFLASCVPALDCSDPKQVAKYAICNTVDTDTDTDSDTDTDTGDPVDADGDGYSPPADCDDQNAAVHPGATEIPGDGLDNDCQNGDADAGDFTDNDGDGYTEEQGDCNDASPSVHPGATEVCDGFDQDCDGDVDDGVTKIYYQDLDQDGYGSKPSDPACSPPDGTYVEQDGDCDDGNENRHPGAAEACTDTEDMNCDGSVPGADADHDSYASCEECDDSDPAIHPGATEICNKKDDDCDGSADEGLPINYYRDADGDTFGDAAAGICASLSGYVNNDDDCDDTKATVYPKAVEHCDDGVDSNCSEDEGGSDNDDAVDMVVECKDLDCDGFSGTKDISGCPSDIDALVAAGQCFVPRSDTWLDGGSPACGANPDRDCDDSDATINWDATEIPGDGIDQDCISEATD